MVNGPTRLKITNAEASSTMSEQNVPTTASLELLDTQQTSSALRVSKSTLERMRLDGSGPPFIKLGAGKKRARVVYRRSDIEAWLKAQSFSATSQYAGSVPTNPERK